MERVRLENSAKLSELMEAHNTEVERLNGQVHSLEEQLSQKDAQNTELRTKIHEKEVELTSQFRERENELNASISELRTQTNETEVLRTRCEELTSHRASSHGQLSELSQQNEQLQQQVHELCQNLSDKGNAYKEVETKLEESEAANKELQTKCEERERDLKELRKRLEEQEERLGKAAEEHRLEVQTVTDKLESESAAKLQVSATREFCGAVFCTK